MLNSVIIGSGSYIPEKVIDSSYFMSAKFYDEKGEPISFRQATYMKSIKRIAEAMKIRGWY